MEASQPTAASTPHRLRQVLGIVALVLISGDVRDLQAAASVRAIHPYGAPTGAPAGNELARGDGYEVSWSRTLESPTWIAYRADPAVHAQLERIQQDIALLCNLPSRAPQLYRGPWRTLEQQIRRLTTARTLFVAVGVLPAGYWQVILYPDPTAKALRIAAFIFPSTTKADSSPLNHLTTVDTLEQLTGLDLFPGLVEGLAAQLEASNHQEWAQELFDGSTAPRLPDNFHSLLDRPELPSLEDLGSVDDVPSDSGASKSGSCIPAASCCRICGQGIACGKSCIARDKTCRVGRGCACNSWEVCG